MFRKVPQAGSSPDDMVIKWLDEDGDPITMGSDEELGEAIAAASIDAKSGYLALHCISISISISRVLSAWPG